MSSCVTYEAPLTPADGEGSAYSPERVIFKTEPFSVDDKSLNRDSIAKLDYLCEAANVVNNEAHALANKIAYPESKDSAMEPSTPKKRLTRKFDEALLEESDGDATIAAPATPPKKRTPPKKGAAKSNPKSGGKANITTPSPKKKRSSSKSSRDNDVTMRNTPRQRQAPKNKISEGTSIPESWDVACAADRMLYDEKQKGTIWGEIREKWYDMTGQETAASTLPNRYNRISANFKQLEPGDDVQLILAYRIVEAAFEREKWARVAAQMTAFGVETDYSTSFLQKKHKELIDDMTNGNAPELVDALQKAGHTIKATKAKK